MTSHHFAVVAPPLPGHWDPLRALAGELVARGHRITFIHMADAAAMVAGTPFGFEAVGHGTHGPGALAEYRRRLARAPSLAGFLPMLRATAAISQMLLQDLPAAFSRLGVDAVIADETEPAAAMVARHLDLPYLTSITGLPLLRDPLVPPPFVPWAFRDDDAGRKRNRGGWRVSDALMRPIRRVLEPHARAWGIDLGEIEQGSPLLQVAQCPPGLDFPRTSLPSSFHYCGPFRAEAAEPPDLPDDLPLVYCSLGSLQGGRWRVFADMAAACAEVGARAIIAHGALLGPGDAARLPRDALVAAHWPQPAVLPRCCAALLHGGFNTVLDALQAAVPIVVSPLAFEQAGTAARVAWTGAGISLPRARLNRRGFVQALKQVLSAPGFGAAAAHLADNMGRLGGAKLAADLIEAALKKEPIRPKSAVASLTA
jgi:UDP:flavonoid glycosyltransferase YjiC (YdhE family)